ncbi:MAG: hypothetical protein ABSC76_10070 [Terracidiphilus sp.]|jgi:chromosome segregation ATPase
MSDSLWKSEETEEAQPEAPGNDGAVQPFGESSELTLSADDFSALEERIQRAVTLVKQERQARAEAEGRADAAEAQLREQAPLAGNLQKEVSDLRAEREQVRQRVGRLLSQLDALEL